MAEEVLLESAQGGRGCPSPSLIPTAFIWSLRLWCPETLHLLFFQALGLETQERAQVQGPEYRIELMGKASHLEQPVLRRVNVYPTNR